MIWHIVCFTIQLCSLKHSTLKVTQFNIQVYVIQHSTLKNACFQYPTTSQSMTVSVGSANYQNSPLVGASKGRSLYPRQQLLPHKMATYFILTIPNPQCYENMHFWKLNTTTLNTKNSKVEFWQTLNAIVLWPWFIF